MYVVKIPIKTTELAHGIQITNMIIQNMELEVHIRKKVQVQ